MENLVNDKTKRQFFALYWDQEIGRILSTWIKQKENEH